MNTQNVIKRANLSTEPPNSVRRTVVKRPLLEAKEEAALILTRAKQEAAALRERAESEAKEIRKTAYKEGYESALAEFNQVILEGCRRRDAALAETEKDLLSLSVRIAEKIIGREITRDSKALADMVANAIRNMRQQNILTIRVNPSDMSLVQEHRERLESSGRARFLDIVSDARVSRYGCVIESDFGTVDAQLETQLRIIENGLLTRAAERNDL